MDIFEKIETEVPESERQQPIGVATPRVVVDENGNYRFINIQYDPDIDQPKVYAYREVEIQHCTDKGYFARKRAEKLYEILRVLENKRGYFSGYSASENEKIYRKVEKMLKKGINFEEYFSATMSSNVLLYAPEKLLDLLYRHGFDLKGAFLADYRHCYKSIYHTFKNQDFEQDSYFLISKISIPTLTKIFTTRKDLNISNEVTERLILDLAGIYRHSEYPAERLEIMFAYGTISLSPLQLRTICTSANANRSKCPTIYAAFDKLNESTSTPDEGKKHTTQKTITQQKRDKKSEAQEMIDKLFEDAQNSVE